ncbi:MAG TPA: choice-of-anchor tandem repeat GloVer-containing protein [Bacteroidia bacterium]|nr:choice-of-anchor tandem repeat GloVer-containing protein [Bacteroidia bacterium]
MRKITVATGIINTIAGNGTQGYTGDGGQATAAELHSPEQIALDKKGNVYFDDEQNWVIRKITVSTGVITTVAGNGVKAESGDGGLATAASLYNPTGIAVDASYNLYISDANSGNIRKVTFSTGKISTFAGNGTETFSGDGGLANAAALNHPGPLYFNSKGNLYISDVNNSRVREINMSTGIINTLAGNGSLGFAGDGGAATAGTLQYPEGISVDTAGNIYIADFYNNRIRKVTASTAKITTFAGNGVSGYGGGYGGDGKPATNANIYTPGQVVLDGKGNMYIADTKNNRVRMVSASTGIITTIAGGGGDAIISDSVPATTVSLNAPIGLAFDKKDNLFITEQSNNTVRKLNTVNGIITLVAGNGSGGYAGDGGQAKAASLNGPMGIALDPAGNLYVGDESNYRVREINMSTGVISTIAGNGSWAYSGDGGPATAASVADAGYMAIDTAGNIYLADEYNDRIRRIDAKTSIITTVAGNGYNAASYSGGYAGDNGPATAAELFYPNGIALDKMNNIYIADMGNNRIREVNTSTGVIITVAGNGYGQDSTGAFTGDGGPATAAEFYTPSNIFVDSVGGMYITDQANDRIRKVTLPKAVAAFAVSDTIIFPSDSITFTDKSTYLPYKWKWTFAGGSPSASTRQNPSVSYSSPGTYSVKLVVYTYSGNDSVTKTVHVTITKGGGTIYAMSNGGSSGEGILFSYDIATHTQTILANFTAQNGGAPTGVPVIDTLTGIMYAATGISVIQYTAANGEDTVFNFTHGNGFQGGLNLVAGPSNGLYYGITAQGGTHNIGTVYTFNPATNVQTIVDNFNGNGYAGGPMWSSLTYDQATGVFYATSYASIGDGQLYSFNPVTNKDTALVVFNSPSSGTYPKGRLTYCPRTGLYYGLTERGGTSGNGDMFSFNPATGLQSIIKYFNDPDPTNIGVRPDAGLLYNPKDGLLYGTNSFGGPGSNNNGTIFTYDPVANVFNEVYTFLGGATDGAVPMSDLAFSHYDGLIYGTTTQGGTSNDGVMFSFDPVSHVETVLLNFNGTNGKGSVCGVIFANPAHIPLTLTGGATSICPGDTAVLSVASTSYTSYVWSTGATTSSIKVAPSATQTYSLTVYKGLYRVDTNITVNVVSFAGAGVNESSKTTCTGGRPDTLTASGGTTYLWSNGATTSTIIVSPVISTTYTVSITKSGCTKDTTVAVGTGAAPVITLEGKDTVCPGINDTITANGGISYLWLPSGGNAASAVLNAPGTYTVQVTNSVCTKDTTVTISNYPVSIIRVTPSPVKECAGSLASAISATGASNYTWAPATGLAFTSGSTVFANPGVTTDYTVTAVDTNGCVNHATDTVFVYPSNGFDLQGSLSLCIDTPGFSQASISACIFNNRCLSVNGTLKLIIDTAIHITSTVAEKSAILSGDTLIWNYDSLSYIGKTHCVSLTGTVDSLHSTDSVFVTEIVTPIAGDSVPSNNSITYWVRPFPYNCVGIPFDPNEKSVSPRGGISNTQQLTYTIHFQNTGTAVARNIVVQDTLSPFVDPTTLKVVSSSSAVTTSIVSGNIVKFTFNNIDLPDTATSKTTSIGIVKYTIVPKSTAAPGNVIYNMAGIYFDNKPVVKTNTTVSPIVGAPLFVENINTSFSLACFPNPFSNTTSVVFNTSGKHYLEVDDITGRKMESIECNGTQYELNRNGLAAGVYFIKAFDQEHNYSATTKIVVE